MKDAALLTIVYVCGERVVVRGVYNSRTHRCSISHPFHFSSDTGQVINLSELQFSYQW